MEFFGVLASLGSLLQWHEELYHPSHAQKSHDLNDKAKKIKQKKEELARKYLAVLWQSHKYPM